MGKYADFLLTGATEDAAAMTRMDQKIQAAKERLRSRSPAAPQEPATSYSEKLLAPERGSVPQESAPEPKQESWGDWIKNSFIGRQDPKEAATGTVYDQFTDQLRSPTATGAMLGANDEGMADIIAKNIGPDYVRTEHDSHGYPVIVSRGSDGREQRGYVNKPGLDTQDMWRTLYGTAPYLVTGGVAGAVAKGAGIGVNALAQGAAAAGTKLATDVGSLAVGSEQSPNLADAAIMGGFGAVGPAAGAATGALWRRFVTIPGLFDKTTGQLTAKGIEAAKAAGLDAGDLPADFAKTFAENLAKSGNPAQAATQTGAQRYGIPATQGQLTKDPYLLTQEEGMRRRLYGEAAQNTMLGFDQQQAAAVRSGALGPDSLQVQPGRSVAQLIAPRRDAGVLAGDRMNATLGSNVQDSAIAAREAARTAENEAWSGATSLESTPQALAKLPDTLNARLGGMLINERATPNAFAMAKDVERIISGEAPEKAAAWVTASPTENVDQMRRNLLTLYNGAESSADKAVSKAIYDGFNDWIGDMAEQGLLKGDPEAAMRLVKARGFTREVRALFEPRDASGALSPGGRRLATLLDPAKADSGEGVIKALIGSNGSQGINTGTVQALTNLKTILERYTPDQAAQAWGDVGLAYWSRLVTGKNGEMLGPMAIANNVKGALQGQQSIMKVLYTPRQLVEISQFMRAVEAIAYKPPNASGSGYTAASFIKDGLLKVLETFGISKAATAAVNYSGIGNAWSSAAAREAVRQGVRPLRPNAAPITNLVGQGYLQDQSSR